MAPVRHADMQHWVAELEKNAYGRGILTVNRARQLVRAGELSGWYITRFGDGWAVARAAGDDSYYLMADGEPITFSTTAAASVFLHDLLSFSPARLVAYDAAHRDAKLHSSSSAAWRLLLERGSRLANPLRLLSRKLKFLSAAAPRSAYARNHPESS